jgi:acyl-phosphate glycerol 3-phosphate acyltransferase
VFRSNRLALRITVCSLVAACSLLGDRAAAQSPSSTLSPPGYKEYVAILGAMMSVVGHSFPIWLRFKGGKGVATSAGALIGLMPFAVPLIMLIWLIVFETTRYVSLASIVGAIA